MLEQRIEELTAAVKALTEMMSVRVTSQPAPEVVKEPKASKKSAPTENAPAAPAVTTTKESAVPSEVPNEQQPPTTDTSPPSEPESAAVTYDDVKKATNALSAAKGRDVTIATLAVFNVQKATQLVEAQWAEYVAYATKVASDE